MSVHPGEPTSDGQPTPLGLAVKVSNWNANPRRRKETLLPHITQLALEGHSSETIARMVEMPSRTVRHWLQTLRQEWIAEAAAGTAEMLALALARLTAIYRAAMEEWRDSPKDTEVRLVEDIQVADDSRPKKTKRSVRTQSQRRNAALLTRAAAAATATFGLKLRAAASQARTAAAGGGAIPSDTPAEEDRRQRTDNQSDAAVDPREGRSESGEALVQLGTPSDEDCEHAHDDGLHANVATNKTEYEAAGRSIPLRVLTEEEFGRMSDDQLPATLTPSRDRGHADPRVASVGAITGVGYEEP